MYVSSWNGRQFGKYVIHGELGRGGMARVFRATDRALQRQVALKILAPQLASDPDSSQRFAREAITAANLRHPNIITIFDVGEVDDLPYIAMEYIAGRTLQAVIDEHGAMGLGYAVALLAPIAEALDYAHQQHAVHRDIKPHNIMLNADGRIVLTDFGIAQAPSAGNQRLTRSGMFMGTPEYIAPEQAAGKPVDGRSDLYSLAIVAYEIITGNVPFHGTIPELLVAHAYNSPPAITSLKPDLPSPLDKVFERALAKDPVDRPPSALAFVDALRTLATRNNIAIPERDDLKALAVAQDSSAGKQTIAMNAVTPPIPTTPRSDPQAATDVGKVSVPQPRPAPPSKPVPQPAPRPAPERSQAAAPRPQPTQQRPAAQASQRPRPAPKRVVRRDVPVAATTNDPIKKIFPYALALMLVVLGVVFWQRSNSNIGFSTPNPTRNNGLTGTGIEVQTGIPTRIDTAIPTDTPEPTATDEPVPTDMPTDTTAPEQPTNTPRPSRTPRPTNTPRPTDVPPTALPPTDLPTAVPPTDLPTAVPPTDPPTVDLPTVTPQVTTQTLPEPTATTEIYPIPTP